MSTTYAEHLWDRVCDEVIIAAFQEAMDSPFDVDEACFNFAHLNRATGLDRETTRAVCRCLTEKGLMRFERFVTSEEGEVRGAGYRLTPKGIEQFKLIETGRT